jgi:hypothetical protein
MFIVSGPTVPIIIAPARPLGGEHDGLFPTDGGRVSLSTRARRQSAWVK